MPVDRLYTPTTKELNEAIDELLYKNEKADAKEVRSALMTAHANWKVPERRVSKYVKRQKKEKNVGNKDNDDDNRSMTGRVSRSVLGVKKALITKLSRRGLQKADAPPASVVSTGTQESALLSKKAEQISEQPPVETIAKVEPVMEKKEEIAAAPIVVVQPEAAQEENASKGVDLDKLYEEENAQENKVGICHACEGCNIL